MALIGNNALVNRQPLRQIGGLNGTDIFAFGFTQSSRNNRMAGAFSQYFGGMSNGYLHPYSTLMPNHPGSLGSYNLTAGVSAAGGQMYQGRNINATPAGSNTFLAGIKGAKFATSNPTGLGGISAAMNGKVLIVAHPVGSGGVTTGSLKGVFLLIGHPAGSGAVTAGIKGARLGAANILASGIVSAGITGSVRIAAHPSASGGISAANVRGIFLLLAHPAGAGSVTAAVNAIAKLYGHPAGSGGAAATGKGPAGLAASIQSFSALTPENIAIVVWNKLIEAGFTAQDLLKIVAAINVGKSSGFNGGAATVEFRDLADTKNRVTGTIDSEGNRTAVSIDAS